jgi:hypothetical protein
MPRKPRNMAEVWSCCRDQDLMAGLPYHAAFNKAEELLAAGWRQSKCPSCGRYTVWNKEAQR